MHRLIIVILFLVFPATSFAGEKPSLTLEEALSLALQHNAQIIESKELIEKQRGVELEALSFIMPRLSLEGNYDITDNKLIESFNDNAFGTDTDWSSGIKLTQPIYAGGKSFSYYAKQQFTKEAAEKELIEKTLDTLLEVKERFFDVLLAESQREVQEESVKLLEEELRSEKNKYAAGEVSQFTVLRAEVAVANGKTPLIRARNRVNLSREELKQVLGLPLENPLRNSDSFEAVGELKYFDYKIALPDALDSALRNRASIRRLKLLVNAAEEGIEVEMADFLPDIDATASYNIEKSRFSDELDDTNRGWRGGIEAKWKIFDSFETSAKIDQAKNDLAIAENLLRQGILDVEVEVRRSYMSFLEARALVRSSIKVVEQAKEALRLSQNRLRAGSGIQLEVLDAQVALTEARSNEVQALFDYNIAIARLKRAIGDIPENKKVAGLNTNPTT